MTWAEFEAMSIEERRAEGRKWIQRWQKNYRDRCQADAEADQRAFARGHGDLDPMTVTRQQGNTTRTPSE